MIAVAEEQFAQFLGKLLDLRLPDMEGVNLLRRMKQTDPHLEGILLASHIKSQVKIEMLQKGAFACLAKPSDEGELAKTIHKAIEKQRLELKRQDKERMKLILAIAHELTSPLTSIALSADLLASETLGARHESLFQTGGEHSSKRSKDRQMGSRPGGPGQAASGRISA